MKNSLSFSKLAMVLIVTGFISCEKATQVKDDTLALAALRNVEFSYDSLAVNFVFPDEALDGNKTFNELLEEDPDTYSNPANYTIEFTTYLLGDNTQEDAEDARFDGLIKNLVMDTIDSNPIEAETGAFSIDKDKITTIDIGANINLETHRLPGLYIFEQTVEGANLDTKILGELLYKIGSKEGSISLPKLQQSIPTRASGDAKQFMQELIDSGIFDE